MKGIISFHWETFKNLDEEQLYAEMENSVLYFLQIGLQNQCISSIIKKKDDMWVSINMLRVQP